MLDSDPFGHVPPRSWADRHQGRFGPVSPSAKARFVADRACNAVHKVYQVRLRWHTSEWSGQILGRSGVCRRKQWTLPRVLRDMRSQAFRGSGQLASDERAAPSAVGVIEATIKATVGHGPTTTGRGGTGPTGRFCECDTVGMRR